MLAMLVVAALATSAVAFAPTAAQAAPVVARAERQRLQGFPTVEGAGFHHLALAYHNDGSTPASFVPYVNRVDTSGAVKAHDPLFDAYLMLAFQAPNGVSMDYGKLNSVVGCLSLTIRSNFIPILTILSRVAMWC